MNLFKDAKHLFALSFAMLFFMDPSTCYKLPIDKIQLLANTLGSTIHNTSFTHMALTDIQTDYLYSVPLVKPLNGTDLLLKIQASLQDIFLSRVEAVEELAKVAEESYESHVYEQNIQFPYPKAKNLSDDFERIQDPFFPGFLVNLTQSTVHVPTNVYDESAPVLNGVAWSKVLDDVFVENHNDSPSISWQYFCSSVGFLRTYPGMSWPKISEVDLFDCRTRGWYIQAATSAKDVIILVDSSGSMRGLRIEIARATIVKIMDTFSENDFFNVIKFSEHPEYLEPCFNGTLVQATMFNRQKILDILSRGIKTQNIAYFDRALIEAFELFKKIEEYGHGAKCNKLIMIITDGAPRKYEKIFEKYNWPDKRIRVFTYLIGREVNDPTNVRWIACNNKGFYSHISTLADVHEHVQDYIHVLSRPLVLAAPNHTVWTNIYGDAITTALTTTVAVPVFDIKNETDNAGNLLGVMGTDVVLTILTNTLPKHQLGVHSYAFAITNNGFIIFHPEHRPYYKGNLKQNYNNLDISEVEFVDTENLTISRDTIMLPIRQEMIKRKTGLMKLRMKVPEDNMRRVSIRYTTYYYIPFNYTPFSLGIAVPDGHSQNYLDGRIRVRNANLNTLKNKELKIAPWQYCWPRDSEDAKLTQYELLLKYLDISKKESSFLTRYCHQDLVESLLFDAAATYSVMTHWMKKNLQADVYTKCLAGNCPKNLSSSGVELLFIGTKAGLTRYLSLVEQLSDPSFLDLNTETNKMLYYTRAIEIGDNIVTVSVPFYSDILDFDPNTTMVTISTPVIIFVNRIPAAAGVVGLQMKYRNLNEIFIQSNVMCSQNATCAFGCDAEEVECYLLDNNGYVVFSEQPELHLGRFFGEIDGEIMMQLVQNYSDNDTGIFRRVEVLDYQAMCSNRDDVYSSGPNLNCRPLSDLFSFLGWLLRKLLVILIYMLTMCWCEDLEYSDDILENVDFLKADYDNDTNTIGSKQEVTLKDINYLFTLSNNNTQMFMQWVNEWRRMVYLQEPPAVIRTWYENILDKFISRSDAYLCTKVYSLYVLQKDAENSLPYSGVVDECKDCEAYFSLHKVPLTNLLLLVIDTTCECVHEKVLISSREITDEDPGSCQQFQLDRAAPETCYNYHPDDNSMMCNGPLKSSSAFLIIPLLVLEILFLH